MNKHFVRALTLSIALVMTSQAFAQHMDPTMVAELKRAEEFYKNKPEAPVLEKPKDGEDADHVVVEYSDKMCVNERQVWDRHQKELADKDISEAVRDSLQEQVDIAYKTYEECLAKELDLEIAGEEPVEKVASKLSAEGKKETKWNKKPLNRNIYFASGVLIAFEITSVAVMAQAPSSVTGWNGRAPEFKNIKRSFTMGPRIDQDHWYWNYLGHPVNGAEYYLLARNRGLKWWQSFLYSTLQSTIWEFGPEAVYERASVQDLIITPLAGSLIGEARYQLKKLLVNKNTGKAEKRWKKVLLVMLDPIDAISGGLNHGYHPAEWEKKK
jgi:Domain of unknown function (DUF3943)